MSTRVRPELPIELWLQIFRCATRTPCTDDTGQTRFDSFQVSRWPNSQLDLTLPTKRTLVQVCKGWRNISNEFLYEDVKISDRGAQALKDALANGFGRWVRRIELPYLSTTTVMYEHCLPIALEIITLCPGLQILARPFHIDVRLLRFDFDAKAVQLNTLRRLDWWHNNEASRSGGINALPDVLDQAPHLQYLSLAGELWVGSYKWETVQLLELKCLRLRRLNGLFLQRLTRWQLPRLSHVILDASSDPHIHDIFWDAFGHQLEVVEFGSHLRFLAQDHVASLLKRAPALECLNYFIFFTHYPALFEAQTHAGLISVGVHSQAIMFQDFDEWAHLEQHFDIFAGPALPALQRVVLFGDWQRFTLDPRFQRLLCKFRGRTCDIFLADGTLLSSLAQVK